MSETPPVEPPAAPPVTPPAEADPPGAEALGDPGKRALDAMKEDRRIAREEAARFKADFEALKAQVDGKESEYQARLTQQKVEQDALSKANERILKAELRAAATGKLADPEDALRFLDLSEFEVGTNGEVDRGKLTAALTALATNKPYLSALPAKRFEGSADQGARSDGTPAQLTKADLVGMTPEAISAAKAKGQFDTLLGYKK